MHYSPYIDLNRDIDVLMKIVEKYEEQQAEIRHATVTKFTPNKKRLSVAEKQVALFRWHSTSTRMETPLMLWDLMRSNSTSLATEKLTTLGCEPPT